MQYILKGKNASVIHQKILKGQSSKNTILSQFHIHFLPESNVTFQSGTSQDQADYMHFNADKYVVAKAFNLDNH